LGYEVQDGDAWVIDFTIKAVERRIESDCNTDEIPCGLYYAAVDMVCGEFLLAKKGAGQELGIDADAAVKRIKEGDTDVTYAVADDSITLDGLIAALRDCGRPQFAAFRRFGW
jgi:hypothetical protein